MAVFKNIWCQLSLNEFECVVTMPKEIFASIVAQDLQNMTHWGGVRAIIQCTLASKSRLKSIVVLYICYGKLSLHKQRIF